MSTRQAKSLEACHGPCDGEFGTGLMAVGQGIVKLRGRLVRIRSPCQARVCVNTKSFVHGRKLILLPASQAQQAATLMTTEVPCTLRYVADRLTIRCLLGELHGIQGLYTSQYCFPQSCSWCSFVSIKLARVSLSV